jgi:predicted RNA binding protein YcfA (HicA-like mRNA interferase family)
VTFAAFVKLLEANGFCPHRQGKGSHRIYRGVVDGKVMLVTVAGHRASDDIKPKNLGRYDPPIGLAEKAVSVRPSASIESKPPRATWALTHVAGRL